MGALNKYNTDSKLTLTLFYCLTRTIARLAVSRKTYRIMHLTIQLRNYIPLDVIFHRDPHRYSRVQLAFSRLLLVTGKGKKGVAWLESEREES